MSWGEVKKINSDFANEPLNFNNYINDISTFKENSYVLDEQNQGLWRSLISQSLTLFGHKAIHETVYNRLTDADADYMLLNNGRLGQSFNSFYRTDSFPSGTINDILKCLTISNYRKMELKFQNAINRYISDNTESNAGNWLTDIFEIDMSGYHTIDEMLADSNLWSNIISSNEPLRLVICLSISTTEYIISHSNNSIYLEFINTVAQSTGATMTLIEALTGTSELDTFFSNESVCSTIANNTSSMIAICYSIAGFSAMINSKTAMEKVAASDIAIKVIIDAITNITSSESVLNGIKGNMTSIEESLPNIANTEMAISEISSVKENISDVITSLHKVTSQTDILITNIHSLISDDVAMSSIISSKPAMDAIAINEEAMNMILQRDTLLYMILTNEDACIAIDPTINNHADLVINTLSNSSLFVGETLSVTRSTDIMIGENVIIVPKHIDSDRSATLSGYSGVNREHQLFTGNPYGQIVLDPCVSLRGLYFTMSSGNSGLGYTTYILK